MLVVWDFHGVLEMGNEYAVTEMSNTILSNNGYSKRFTDEQVKKLYGKKWWQYFKYLLPEESNNTWMNLQSDCFKYNTEHPEIIAKYIILTPGALEVIELIKSKGLDQIIISNTNTESLPLFLKAVGLIDHFSNDHAFAVDNQINLSQTKNQVLRKYLKNKIYERIIIIGDSLGDMALKSVAGGTTFLYTHPGLIHRDCEADYKIHDLREVLKIL